MAQPAAITSLPPSPDEERRRRFVQYSVAMGVRLVCLFAAFFFTTGWLQLVCVIGAVVLPSIAVILANAKHGGGSASPVRPGQASLPPGAPR